MTTFLLEVKNLGVHFHYPVSIARAVDGVSLAVKPGETLGIVGESGCGKSLTALAIMGLIESPGRIEPGSQIIFGGRDLTSLREDEFKQIRGREISMVFQEPMTSLNPVYTVGQQVIEAIAAHERVTRRAAVERAVDLLRVVGISMPERRIHDYPHQLSGGMLQRVMIAIAVSCNPRLLIADEPTTALDVTIQAQILDLMRELCDRAGMSLILISHDFGVVAEMVDKVAVMYAGRVVERGSLRDIFGDPQHPYTRALLGSIPRLGTDRRIPLQAIEGMVPSPFAWPEACRFAPRCPLRFDRCTLDEPRLGPTDHSAACWLAESRADTKEGVA